MMGQFFFLCCLRGGFRKSSRGGWLGQSFDFNKRIEKLVARGLHEDGVQIDMVVV